MSSQLGLPSLGPFGDVTEVVVVGLQKLPHHRNGEQHG